MKYRTVTCFGTLGNEMADYRISEVFTIKELAEDEIWEEFKQSLCSELDKARADAVMEGEDYDDADEY